MNLHTVNTKVKGKINVFIPDLFLVMQDNGYIKEVLNGKFEAARDFSEHVTFEYNKYTPEYLKSMGYIVPAKYEMWGSK
jgi:hypothetical protein